MPAALTFSQINDVLRGSIDMHLHFGPDPIIPRRVDALSAAIDAQQAGMRAIVLKSHSFPTAPSAYAARQAVPDIEIIGSLCLDEDVGGLNTHAIETSAKLGAKIVWLPTFSAANSIQKAAKRQGRVVKSKGIYVLDQEGKLVPDAVAVVRSIKDHDLVLATGHLDPAETFAIVDECERVGLTKIVITHPLEQTAGEKLLTLDQMVALARRGAFIELCMLSCCPAHNANLSLISPNVIVEAIEAVSPAQCILGSDLGVAWNPPPTEGMRMFISVLLRHGVREEDVRRMAQVNSARLLGLDAWPATNAT